MTLGHKVLRTMLCSGLLLVLVAGPAIAARHPLAAVAYNAACHESIHAAAVAGLLAAAAKSRRVEYGGAVFQRNVGCYVHSIPVTSNRRSELEYRVPASRADMTLVGIYHTHTPGRYAHQFSERDVAVQRQLGVTSWLGTLDGGGSHLTIRSLPDAGHPQIISLALHDGAQRQPATARSGLTFR